MSVPDDSATPVPGEAPDPVEATAPEADPPPDAEPPLLVDAETPAEENTILPVPGNRASTGFA